MTGTERWYPSTVSLECGKPLDMESATVAATRQMVDIPLPIMATVVNHLQMRVKCICWHCCKGQFPENVNSPVSYGPNFMAMTSYLSVYQNVPLKRLTWLFETIFGLHISEGSESNIQNAMRRLSKKPYEMIRWKVAATYLAFDGSRSHDVVNRDFSLEEQGGTVRGTDRWPAYFMFMGDVGIEDHQIDIAHLLRNLTNTMQAFLDDAWSLDMLDLLRVLVHQRHQGNIGHDVRTKMEERLDELLARPPVYTNDGGKETELNKLKKSIAKHRVHVFTLLMNPAVPPTNNDSERALRSAKTKLKISGCFRTENGVENYATVAPVIQTAAKNGQNPFEDLRGIATLAQA